MSVSATPETSAPTSLDTMVAQDERGDGWVAFAGAMLLMLGSLNAIEGIAAIGNAHFFIRNTSYIVGSLNTWGWIVLVIGVVQLCVGLGVFMRNQFSRWAGVVILGLNAIAQLLMIPAYPFWSLSIFAIDVLAIYALITYGRRIPNANYW